MPKFSQVPVPPNFDGDVNTPDDRVRDDDYCLVSMLRPTYNPNNGEVIIDSTTGDPVMKARTVRVKRSEFLTNPQFPTGFAAYGMYPVSYYYWNNAYANGNTYITMNKNTEGGDASHVYCCGGRAQWEVGATTEVPGGANDFHFKMVHNTSDPYDASQDQFIDVLMIDWTTGNTWLPSPYKLGIGGKPTDRLHLVSLGPGAAAARVTATFENANGGAGSQSAGLLFKGIDIARSWMVGSDYGMNGNSNFFIAHGSGTLACLVTQTTFEVKFPLMMGLDHGVYSAGAMTSGAGSSTITDERFVGGSASECANVNHFKANGTIYAPTNTVDGDFLSKWQAFGYSSGYFSAAGISMIHLGTTGGGVYFATHDGTSYSFRWRFGNAGNFIPYGDNLYTVGSSGLRVKEVFAATGTINTSDAREKTAVRPFNAKELACARALAGDIGVFQWLDSVKQKGKRKARKHIGMTVQHVMEVMRDHGLDPFAYGFICYDKWDAEKGRRAKKNRKTGEVTPALAAVKAGDRYGFREGQLLAWIMRGQAQVQAEMDARLAALERAMMGSGKGE